MYSKFSSYLLLLALVGSLQSSGWAKSSSIDGVLGETTSATTSTLSTTTTAATTSTPTTMTTSPPTARATSTTTTSRKPDARNCLAGCSCTGTRVSCENLKLATVPTSYSRTQYNFTEMIFRNNSIETFSFQSLPMSTVELLDLSENRIKTIVSAPKKSAQDLSRLRVLNLSGNLLESATNLSLWKLPALEQLYLTRNPLQRIGPNDFNSTKVLQRLDLQQLKLKSIDELALAPLGQLRELNLSSAGFERDYHLPDQIFAKNSLLKTVDLSNNSLVEIPTALRSTNSIESLILNSNLMTSLRRSDLINRFKLERLEIRFCPELRRVDEMALGNLTNVRHVIMSNNPKLSHFSSEAFRSSDDQVKHKVKLLDLAYNNLSTLADPAGWLSFQSSSILLNGNPWECGCELRWLLELSRQQGQLIHCESPARAKHLEISQFFQTIDCQLEESSYQRLVLAVFLIFLFVLMVLVFIQKNDIWRRFQWRDQYGTIYYTKASFPSEAV